MNGACPSGCDTGRPAVAEADWHGHGCRIGNVAFNKPALHTGKIRFM